MSQSKPATTAESNVTPGRLSLRKETVRLLSVKSGIMTGSVQGCTTNTQQTTGGCRNRKSVVVTQ
jgi:hypothetical protein